MTITKASQKYSPIIDIDVLKKCSKGLAKRYRSCFHTEKQRLKIIKEEIDLLISEFENK